MNITDLDTDTRAFLRRFTLPRQRAMVALFCAIVTRGEASDVDTLIARAKLAAQREIAADEESYRVERFTELVTLLIRHREEGRALAQAVLTHGTRIQSVLAGLRFS